jgi:CRP/FNR family transcriptional regulator, cyclic AMP receptor protein
VDEDRQEVIVDEPAAGEFFGFASMLEQTPHQTCAIAAEEAVCVEVDRDDIAVLLQRKPLAGMDTLTVLGRQFHASQQLVRVRSTRNPNEVIEREATFGDRVSDAVPRLGSLSLHPFELVPVHAGRASGADHHDEPEPPGRKGPPAQ